ncbi:MAG TPA: ATP-binding cassette domain-containing protein [Microbacterium sp.]|nr:ATP-binding cassette domain-containing protein [Microbacterium sp.]
MITVQNISKTIGKRPIVHDVSFAVPDGSITGFVGPNGAGKTTTMRLMLGLTRSDAGSARFDGLPYRDLPSPLVVVGSLLDARGLLPHLRVREVLEYCARTQNLPSRTRELLDLVGLIDAEHRRVADLSLGMRQRLGLAVALLGSPRNLVLDEPVNGLDPTGIAWLRDVLRHLRSEGCAILLSSHIISELALIADDAVVLNRGRIVLSGPVSALAAQGHAPVLAHVARPDDLIAAVEATDARARRTPGGAVSVTGMTARDVFALAAAHGIILDDLTTAHPTLDDIYRNAVGTTAAQENS